MGWLRTKKAFSAPPQVYLVLGSDGFYCSAHTSEQLATQEARRLTEKHGCNAVEVWVDDLNGSEPTARKLHRLAVLPK